ncbi:MAG: 2-polyprenyl-3-methyl-6-methoxy-1,4-benzoquinone monooxygenase [Acidiferrobacter sp.]
MITLSRRDRLIDQADQMLKTFVVPTPTDPYPQTVPRHEPALTPADQARAARLMRVNHAGEIAAQALYHGHALGARHSAVYNAMRGAARDELQHLRWTSARLRELKSHRSYLTPLWYAGSLAMGAATALLGDTVSLGFVAETERQVVVHLHSHIARLPKADQKSRSILEHMVADEGRHATQAVEAGGRPLRWPARLAMRLAARVMTGTAYWL